MSNKEDQGLLFESLDEFDLIKREWINMPEFHQEDIGPHRQLVVSFKNEEDVQAFAKLIDQNITFKTKSLWFPFDEHVKQFDKVYVDKKIVPSSLPEGAIKTECDYGIEDKEDLDGDR